MTIEQTTQLVQLILNAAIMVAASGIVLGVATLHQIRLEKQRRSSLHILKRTIRQEIRRQLRQVSRSIFYLNVACLVLITSTGLLALRALVDQSVLISLSLLCFAIGCLIFLVGVGLFLLSVMTYLNMSFKPIDLRRANLSGIQLNLTPTRQNARTPRRRSHLPASKITPLDVSTAPSNLVMLRDRTAR